MLINIHYLDNILLIVLGKDLAVSKQSRNTLKLSLMSENQNLNQLLIVMLTSGNLHFCEHKELGELVMEIYLPLCINV